MDLLVARFRFAVVGLVLPLVVHVVVGASPLVAGSLGLVFGWAVEWVVASRGGVSCLRVESGSVGRVARLLVGALLMCGLVALVLLKGSLVRAGVDSFTAWWGVLALIVVVGALAQHALGEGRPGRTGAMRRKLGQRLS